MAALEPKRVYATYDRARVLGGLTDAQLIDLLEIAHCVLQGRNGSTGAQDVFESVMEKCDISYSLAAELGDAASGAMDEYLDLAGETPRVAAPKPNPLLELAQYFLDDRDEDEREGVTVEEFVQWLDNDLWTWLDENWESFLRRRSGVDEAVVVLGMIEKGKFGG